MKRRDEYDPVADADCPSHECEPSDLLCSGQPKLLLTEKQQPMA
jgi:hypothetical protein